MPSFQLRAMLAASAFATLTALAPVAAHAQSTAVMAVASTFTTMDPYDANDTLSQAVAKSFYEGLFGFDKDMNLIPVPWVDARDVSNAVLFLASDEARYITGTALPVDAGIVTKVALG